MLGKCQQLELNPGKENDIVQPVEVAQVAAVVTLQDHQLKKRRSKKQKRSSANSFEANSDTEAQLLIQQQQTLNLTKQKSLSKDTEGYDAPNHSTRDQSPTRNIINQIDLEEGVIG